ncbi:MAG: peptide ABC transporter substrate-binding protein [Chloroflexota bacterium]
MARSLLVRLVAALVLTAASLVAPFDVRAQGAASSVRLPLLEPPTLDPGLAEDVASVEVINQLFDALVAFDEVGQVSGRGAEQWTISADGLVYTFTLRANAVWSDGKPVVAGDYVWAWQRNIDPATASPYANALFPIKHAQAINQGSLPPSQLGVEARGDTTLVVTLEQPAAFFLRLASTWSLMPLRQDVIEAYGDSWTEPEHIVTNGPYLLTEWSHNSLIVLDRNEGYGGEKPSIARAVFRLFPEDGSEQMLASYEAGELDTTGAGVPAELPTSQIDRILADRSLSAELRSFPQSGTTFIVVNHRKPHLQDARVRQAISLALDRREILDAVLKRAGSPAATIQAEGIVGRVPSAWMSGTIAEAQALMAAAGYPNGQGFPEITFTVNTSAEWRLFAEYFQQRMLDTLGIRVKIETMELATFLKWRRGEEWAQRGDLYRASWFSDYEDPNNWYNVLWESGADPNAFNGGWRSSRFDTLVKAATAEQDLAKRRALYEDAERVMAAEQVHVPLFHYEVRSLVKPRLQGYNPSRVLGLTPLRTMRLEAGR